VSQSRLVELLGEPDAKSDSPVVKNWLYRYDAALNDEQVWIATIMVAITDGIVTKAERRFESRSIEDLQNRLARPGDAVASPKTAK
jgi:hypothetical protein